MGRCLSSRLRLGRPTWAGPEIVGLHPGSTRIKLGSDPRPGEPPAHTGGDDVPLASGLAEPATRVARDRGPTRCPWASGSLLTAYHDREWGVPVHDDARHLELLVLEGAQAGLSWQTVLRRRDGYRRAFAAFDPAQVAAIGKRQVEALLADASIIRHRRKIESAISNAVAVLDIEREFGSFDAYIWGFVGGAPLVNRRASPADVPSQTPLSAALSAALRGRGFRFAGPTRCYSYLQAAGLVLDHLTSCFRFPELAGSGRSAPTWAPTDRGWRRRSPDRCPAPAWANRPLGTVGGWRRAQSPRTLSCPTRRVGRDGYPSS